MATAKKAGASAGKTAGKSDKGKKAAPAKKAASKKK
jgi:hypothetical protein